MTANDLSSMCRDLAPRLGDHLWQSTLFAGAVWLLAFTLRRYQARTRYWLWLAASAKFLVPFSLLVSVGSHLGWSSHMKAGMYAALDEVSQPFTEMTVRDTSTSVAALPMVSHPWVSLLPGSLAVVWLCGFVGVMVFWWVQWRRISVAMREAEPLREGREIEALRRMEWAAGISKPIEVLLSRDSMEPGVFGVLRPVLLWPAGISQHLGDAHLEAVLAHEVCHVRRRDNLTSVMQMLVEAVFWFHPLVWWLESRLVEERERACDEEVLLLCGQPQVYAESILKVCEFCVGSPLVCLSGVTGADLKKRIVRIMSRRLGGSLSRGRKVALAVLGFAVVIGPVAFGVVRGMIPMYGQILHTSGPLPSFEVVTIKPWKATLNPPPPPSDGTAAPRKVMKASPVGGGGQPTNRVHLIGQIEILIASAYNLPVASGSRILGGPDWVNRESDRYEIQAKIEDSLYAAMQKMTPAQQQEQVALMEQSLLADRFKLKMHFETKEMPVYALVVANGGPKLTPAKDGESSRLFTLDNERGSEMTASAVTLDEFVRSPLLRVGGRLVVNQTGLKGIYDFTLKSDSGLVAQGAGQGADAPSLFTAIQEQLGLKLVSTKGPVEVIVIDHIERPSEN